MPNRQDPLFGMMTNPLVSNMFSEVDSPNEEIVAMKEEQKDRELRLLGTMLFQALFLSLCILLYDRWTWSQFSSPYESMVFWFTASFALQAGIYFVYRATLEDSSQHRKGLKRLRRQSRQKLTQIKYQHERMQLEQALAQQQMLFNQSIENALSDDGKIDAREQEDINQALLNLLATMQEKNSLGNNQGADTPLGNSPQSLQPSGTTTPPPPTPEELGIDRHRMMGVIPMSPSLTIPQRQPIVPMEQPSRPNPTNIDLTPQGTDQQNSDAEQ
jgi:hypothetical protein